LLLENTYLLPSKWPRWYSLCLQNMQSEMLNVIHFLFYKIKFQLYYTAVSQLSLRSYYNKCLLLCLNLLISFNLSSALLGFGCDELSTAIKSKVNSVI
jgi:hypothetical protein